MEVRVAMLAPYKWRVGQVVWADSGEKEYGIELHRPENFWGIFFPPEDWELGVPTVTVFSPSESSGATQPRSTQKKAKESVADTSALHVPEGGTIAILRGIASNGMPFQERDLILPVGEHHASMLIGPLVELGTTVSVIFSKNVLEKAIVTAVSHSREYDRWRVWLSFSKPLMMGRRDTTN
jgi:hypothetical protein